MKARVMLRPGVVADLQSILAYLASNSLSAADRFADAVAPTLDALAAMPGKGSLKSFRHPELSDIRSWNVAGFRDYLILYRPIAGGIQVLAIVHGARDLPSLLNGRT